MKIALIKQVKAPIRSTDGSAGIDFYVPDSDIYASVHPGCSVSIPSGVIAEVPKGFALIAFNKSGICSDSGLVVGACVVDSDYQGEIHLHVINTSHNTVMIKPGTKLVQFLLIPVYHCKIDVVNALDLHTALTRRGSGGFGSTGI